MAMEKEIPVYIFMGFLGAGKTKFAKETLMEQDFTEMIAFWKSIYLRKGESNGSD